jgi:drug/metabolite transporter (DMT)-like permease/proteasome lid subunit RPN8/RPN11
MTQTQALETAAPRQSAPSSRNRQVLALVGCYALVCMIWGTTWIGIKYAVTDMPPLLSSGLRFLLAAPVFLAACRYLKVPVLFPRELTWFAVMLTMTYFAIPFYLYNFGEQYISSGLTAICFGAVSILMVLFAVPILGARITLLQITSVTSAFVALGLLVLHTQRVTATSPWGVVAVLVAAVLHAYSYIMIKKHATALHALTLNTLPMTAAGIGLVGLSLITDRPGMEAFTTRSVVATLYLGIVASVIGFGVYFWLVQKLNTVTVSFVFVIFPVIAQFFSIGLEKAAFSAVDLVLTAVIVAAFAVTQWGQYSASRATAAESAPGPEPISPRPGSRWPTQAELDEIYRHASAAYPAECCGFVTDSGVQRCVNTVEDSTASDRTRGSGFAFGAPDLLRLARSFDSDAPARFVYHSHPDVGAYFSEEDGRFAVVDGEPVYPVDHLVVDATAEGVRGSRLFAFDRERGRYVEHASFGEPR